jgi:RNA polymerase sigma factor (sigma-70 family)
MVSRDWTIAGQDGLIAETRALIAEPGRGMAGGDRLTAEGARLIAEQDRLIAEAVERDEPRLRRFIRARVADIGDAEDVLQDVFYELTETYRRMNPVEQVTAWLYRVARNRITDLFRRRKAGSLNEVVGENGEGLTLEELLPSPDAGPDALYARRVLLEALDAALDELPEAQREVFVAHEVLGLSFKEIAEQTGVGVNTLLARKRYAVLELRERLRELKNDLDLE